MTDIFNPDNLSIDSIMPDGCVNLAYYSVRKPIIAENIRMANMLETTDVDYISIHTGDDITSRFFYLTDQIEGEVPLYFVYTLKYQLYNVGNTEPYSIICEHSIAKPDKYILKPISTNMTDTTISLSLFTNFWMDSTLNMYVIYNAIINGKLVLDHKELINPVPYMKANNDDGVLAANEYRITLKEADTNTYTIEVPSISTYYLNPIDGKNIQAKTPIDIDSCWYPRITNGCSSRYIANQYIPEKAVYLIKDYYSADYFCHLGAPYSQVTESGTVTGKNTIKLSNGCIYAPINEDGEITNISVTVNDISTDVISIDATNGIVNVSAILNPNDKIVVTYIYIEDAYIYKGYYKQINDTESKWIPLDLNPCKGHSYGYYDQITGSIKIEPSFKLLNKTICIYAIPAIVTSIPIAINDDTINIKDKYITSYVDLKLRNDLVVGNTRTEVRTKYSNMFIPFKHDDKQSISWSYIDNSTNMIRLYNPNFLSGEPIVVSYTSIGSETDATVLKRTENNVLFHTVGELSLDEIDRQRAILIAKLYVRPSSSKDMINLIDTRTRGGGIKPIDDHIRMNYNPETQYFLDIGNIDGEPLQENAVIIIKVNKYLLKKYGGLLEELQIEEAIKKHKGVGILPVIQYVEPDDHSRIL